MFVQNNGPKPRVLRVHRQDCETPEALALWSSMYSAQKREDLARRKTRIAHGQKRRDAITPGWKLDPFLRIVLNRGRTVIPDEFSALVEKAFAGEMAAGRLSVSGLPEKEDQKKRPLKKEGQKKRSLKKEEPKKSAKREAKADKPSGGDTGAEKADKEG